MALDKDVLYQNLLQKFKGMLSDGDFSKGTADACAEYLKLGQVVSSIGSAPPGSIVCDGSVAKPSIDSACSTMSIQPPAIIQYTGDEILATGMSAGLNNMMNAMQVSSETIASATGVFNLQALHDGILDVFKEMKKKPEENENQQGGQEPPEPPRDKDEIMAEGIADAFSDYLQQGVLTVVGTSGQSAAGYII